MRGSGHARQAGEASVIERRLAALVAGPEAGWWLWNAALQGLELAIEGARSGRSAFAGWPRGELNRLLVDVEDALAMAALAVDLREVVGGLEDEPDARSRHEVAELLLDRAREACRARGLPLSNRDYGVGASARR